ncbi:MAG: hypothetical protein WBQ73_00990 [Candidatus Babeliales bacterium]
MTIKNITFFALFLSFVPSITPQDTTTIENKTVQMDDVNQAAKDSDIFFDNKIMPWALSAAMTGFILSCAIGGYAGYHYAPGISSASVIASYTVNPTIKKRCACSTMMIIGALAWANLAGSPLIFTPCYNIKSQVRTNFSLSYIYDHPLKKDDSFRFHKRYYSSSRFTDCMIACYAACFPMVKRIHDTYKKNEDAYNERQQHLVTTRNNIVTIKETALAMLEEMTNTISIKTFLMKLDAVITQLEGAISNQELLDRYAKPITERRFKYLPGKPVDFVPNNCIANIENARNYLKSVSPESNACRESIHLHQVINNLKQTRDFLHNNPSLQIATTGSLVQKKFLNHAQAWKQQAKHHMTLSKQWVPYLLSDELQKIDSQRSSEDYYICY